MTTLCALLRVPKKHFDQTKKPATFRETDFFLIDPAGQYRVCEVKLMGVGNPESADGALAKDTTLFVADKLSDSNKVNLDKHDILWVELRGAGGLPQLQKALTKLGIPCQPFTGDMDKALDKIYATILKDDDATPPNPFLAREGEHSPYGDYLVDLD